MFGDILSDEASVISGSLGLLPSASIGKGAALFEPIHVLTPRQRGKTSPTPSAASCPQPCCSITSGSMPKPPK